MNRKYRIGTAYLLGVLGLLLVMVCAFQYSYDKARKKQLQAQQEKELSVETEGSAKKGSGYVLKACDGYVVVYYADEKQVFEYTSILVKNLPADVARQVKAGMQLESVRQVYGFLENYSS